MPPDVSMKDYTDMRLHEQHEHLERIMVAAESMSQRLDQIETWQARMEGRLSVLMWLVAFLATVMAPVLVLLLLRLL